MSALPWLVGGGALAAYLWSRGKTTARALPPARDPHALPPASTPSVATAPTPSTRPPAPSTSQQPPTSTPTQDPRPSQPSSSKPPTDKPTQTPQPSISKPPTDTTGKPTQDKPSTSTQTAPPPPSPGVDPLPGRWVWPVAKWRDRVPVVSSGVGSPRPKGPHRGVDIMFKRKPTDPFPRGTPNGSKWHVMPDNVVALAAGDGMIWSAGPTAHGQHVVIDHGPLKVATFYTHMEKLFVTPTNRAQSRQRVQAGQPIGIIGFSPLDGERLKHLHFELWRGGPKDWVDPEPLLKMWPAIDDPRGPNAIRNASLVYRPVGAPGEPYPEWVRTLKDKSGVYVIREIGGDIVYVGSSVGRLYDTLTRHLQTWRRWKGFWKGQYGEGHDPGLTYDRDSVEIAVRITSPADAFEEEMRLIRRLKPRDNLIGQPELEEAPF